MQPDEVPVGSAPLEGLVVADFSRVLAGPLLTMTLADLGARVIKVERPGAGDDTRAWGPPWSATGATYFEAVNRNKESVTLDLRDPGDLKLGRELATRADVMVENFKAGGMDALGLGYESLREDNPGLVYCSITGFGASGGASLPGYDFVVQALGGLMHVTGERDGDPMKVGVALVDVLTAKDGAIGVLAALRERERTGVGRRIDVNLLSSLQASLVNQVQANIGAGVEPGRLGNVHPSISPYQTLRASDGPFAVAIGNDGQFRAFCAALGLNELASDPRFATNPDRVANRDALDALCQPVLDTRTAAEWEERLRAARVPVGRVNTIGEGLAFAEELGLEPVIDLHDREGLVVGAGVRHPATFTPSLPRRADAPPALGADSDAVRAWLTTAENAGTPSAPATPDKSASPPSDRTDHDAKGTS